MRGADQCFPMMPYRALFTVTHRNESGTGCQFALIHKILILRGKSAIFLSDIIHVPRIASPTQRSRTNETRMGCEKRAFESD